MSFPVGATVYLDGEVRVRVRAWWPEGSTTQHGAYYEIEVPEVCQARVVLADRTGSAEELNRLPPQKLRVQPDRLGVRRKR